MKTLKAGLFTVLVVVLAACSSAPPSPELQTGVDEIGAYTVVAQSGDETLSAQASAQNMPTRVMQIREYSGSRFRSVFTLKFPRYTMLASMDASNGIYSDTYESYPRGVRYAEKMNVRYPKELSVASDVRYFARRTSGGLAISVCGLAKGNYQADDFDGSYHYADLVEFRSKACYYR